MLSSRIIATGRAKFMQDIQTGNSPFEKKPRQQLLEAPLEFLPISAAGRKKLSTMGFLSVGESFRAALIGRLSARKNGTVAFENSVLKAGCKLLGHPEINRSDLKNCRPRYPGETIRDALNRLNGQPFKLTDSALSKSIRDILFPTARYEALNKLGVETVGELLDSSMKDLLEISGVGPKNLGNFLAHTFDYIFIINEPEFGLPSVIQDMPTHSADSALDIHTKLLLSSWFSDKTLKAGFKLLQGDRLRNVFFYRNCAGGQFYLKKFHYSVLTFDDAPQISQGFRISHAECELCDRNQGIREYCRHSAAVAIRFLDHLIHEEWKKRPLPMLYPDTIWYLIGRFLFDLHGNGRPAGIKVRRHKGMWHLTVENENKKPSVSWTFTPWLMRQAVALFGNKFEYHEGLEVDEAERENLVDLFVRITSLARTPTEIELNELCEHSIAQDRDESIWSWLAGKFCMTIPDKNIHVERSMEDGLFSLTATDPVTGSEMLNLTLPRDKTPDFLASLAVRGIGEKPLPPARAFCKIYFDEDESSLIVSPRLRLNDGTVFIREEMEAERYNRCYYLEGEGFLPVEEQKQDVVVFDNPYSTTRVESNDVPAFLEQYRRALHAEGNEIAPELFKFAIQDAPDRIELNSFQVDENWCYLSGRYGVGNRTIFLEQLMEARNDGLEYLPGKKKWLKLTDSPLEWFHNLGAERVWYDSDGRCHGIRLSRRELLTLSALIPDLHVKTRSKSERTALQKLLEVEEWQDHNDLPSVPEHLREYQRNGLAWLFNLYRNQLGGILADDMGLGKTHQALGLLWTILNNYKGNNPFLIVCPATVVSHWVEKIRQFFPVFDYYVYHGSNREIGITTDSRILFITTYGIVRRDVESLSAIEFEVIIFDEVQHVKNKKTGVHDAASRLNGRFVLGLTGTPLENSVYDLKAIFDVCLPGFLGKDASFKKYYAVPIEEDEDNRKRDTLARLIKPFLLRRTRIQVLTELPDIIEDVRTCELSEDQVRLYRQMIANMGRPIVERLVDKEEQQRLPYMEILAVINYLKQICDHPALLDDSYYKKYSSGKWDLFVDLLDECLASSIKVVVFSHYTRMLDIIETYLGEAGIPFCGLRGNMSLKQREKMIRRFNTDDSCKVFSASLLAGGIGVDLTAAQAVIHYDRWWNAAREDQATARVHRMGQKNVVQVFKLVTVGTLEEKIHRMIEKKRDLAEHLVRADDASITKRLSREELMELLYWENME
ncbi:MAG: SNF2-related protein [Thermodesulfobacteriota bacterium]|nr:SNF2-related protein [Thermodesulfobacteriota bacterium]